ncbi:MFS transporter [Desulfurella sp.]|uniref:MFS transporter n=1 Tax=Desulfurella sp. TaxID=1962857 RepID=UPI0025C03D90|nr:MFS transporter [Desulfurella sp.]
MESEKVGIKTIYFGALAGWILDSFNIGAMFLLIPILASQFFSINSTFAIVGAWSIATTTFVFRPIGGIYFGALGDKIGRKKSMIVTLVGLGLSVFLTGFLPTYSKIGIFAPLLLVVFRIITGFFAGGEYGSSAVIIQESVDKQKKGIWGAALQAGFPIGYTFAAIIFLLLHYFLGKDFLEYGWRWMFWIGSIAALLGLIVRYRMPESALWEETSRNKKLRKPLKEIFTRKKELNGLLTGILAMTGIAWIYGLTLGFYPTILSFHKFILFPKFLYVVIVAILSSLVGYILSGYISDKIGRKKIIIIYSITAIVFSVGLTYLITHILNFYEIVLLSSVLAFITTGIFGVMPSFLAEKFSTIVRNTGVGASFNGGFILGQWSVALLLLIIKISSPSFFILWGIFIMIGELMILSSALLSKETKGIDLYNL